MFSRSISGILVMAVVATLVTGGVAPQPAQANDTGRILAGLAAGAIVYGLLGDNDRGRDRGRYDDRGFYNGNAGSWQYGGRPAYRPSPYDSGSRQYRRGYNDGFDDGRQVGYSQGWNNGYDYGYDRGYDRGYDNGYDRGRRSNWGCW